MFDDWDDEYIGYDYSPFGSPSYGDCGDPYCSICRPGISDFDDWNDDYLPGTYLDDPEFWDVAEKQVTIPADPIEQALNGWLQFFQRPDEPKPEPDAEINLRVALYRDNGEVYLTEPLFAPRAIRSLDELNETPNHVLTEYFCLYPANRSEHLLMRSLRCVIEFEWCPGQWHELRLTYPKCDADSYEVTDADENTFPDNVWWDYTGQSTTEFNDRIEALYGSEEDSVDPHAERLAESIERLTATGFRHGARAVCKLASR